MKKYKGIVIHHSASKDVSAREIDRWHKERGWDGIGYHFVVRKDGSIEPGRPIDRQGAHAHGRNKTHLGICLTGNFDTRFPSATQLVGLKYLLKGLVTHYGIKEKRIERHHEKCPGRNLPMSLIKSIFNLYSNTLEEN